MSSFVRNAANKELKQAVRAGDLKKVKEALEHGANIDDPGQDGKTALSLAAIEGHVNIAKYLIEKGASLNLVDGMKGTPLSDAVRVGKKDIVELLLQYNVPVPHFVIVDVAQPYPEIEDILRSEMDERRSEHERGVNRKIQYDLYSGVQEGDLKKVKAALEHGAEIDYPMPGPAYHDRPVVYEAAYKGHKDIVELLIMHGANINIMDDGGWNAIYGAAVNGKTDTVRLLLNHGAIVTGELLERMQRDNPEMYKILDEELTRRRISGESADTKKQQDIKEESKSSKPQRP